jgi:hypothetical protein
MAVQVIVLDSIWGQVLSLLQFKDILLPVDDSETHVFGVELADVSSPQPSVRPERLLCYLRQLIVARNHLRTTVQYLASRTQSTVLINIFRRVLHLGNIRQSPFKSRLSQWYIY